MATRPEDLANAYEAIAGVNHYMVGLVDPRITADERDEAEQILIARQNELKPSDAGSPEWDRLELALDLLEQDRRTVLHRASQGGGHPQSVTHDGKVYTATGKSGVHTESGEHAAEYQHREPGADLRLWHRIPSGIVYED